MAGCSGRSSASVDEASVPHGTSGDAHLFTGCHAHSTSRKTMRKRKRCEVPISSGPLDVLQPERVSSHSVLAETVISPPDPEHRSDATFEPADGLVVPTAGVLEEPAVMTATPSPTFAGSVMPDPAPTDLDPTEDGETLEVVSSYPDAFDLEPLEVSEDLPDDPYSMAIVTFRTMGATADEGLEHASEGLTASAVQQRVEELLAACARTSVPPPSLDLRIFDSVIPDRRYVVLQEIEHDLIAPCMEILTSISWERLATRYESVHGVMYSRSRVLSRADMDLHESRRDFRTLEGQLICHLAWSTCVQARGVDQQTLAHLAWRTVVLERQLEETSRLVDHHFMVFQQCSRAYDTVRIHLHRIASFERRQRDRALSLLGRLNRELEDLYSSL